MGRYPAIGFFPIALLLLLWTIFDAPALDSVPIKVFRRIPPVR